MSSEERRKILQMVADGKISAEEAATLMRALEDSAEEGMEVIEAVPGAGVHEARSDAPEFDEVRKRALRFAMIPLWVGIVFTVLSAWAMFSIQQNAGLNFWFFCMSMPFVLGVLLIAMGAGSRSARWLYVNVDRSQASDGDGPKQITIAFPLPLGFAGWFLKNFGSRIGGLNNTNVDEVVQAIAMAKNITEPLIVNVDAGDGGEKVQVFIG
ncbi:MAG: SHOCT-like domain-containing protein [Anaerolineales bacterium]